MSDNVDYKYNGAKALVALQEEKLRSFLTCWRIAKELNISLPETDDKDYQSLETLLFHVLRASRGYLNWICENLKLQDPAIDPIPKLEVIEEKAGEYLEYLLNKWKHPLKDLDEKVFHENTYKSRWGVEYCIDAMLEHAVMHPIRHEYQLNNLITNS